MEIFEKAKKEPDTVAAVTDSEQEDLVDVPADIVPQEAENVKAIVKVLASDAEWRALNESANSL